MNWRLQGSRSVLAAALLFSAAAANAQPTFTTFHQAKPALEAYRSSLPLDLRELSPSAMQAKWPDYIRNRDLEVRARLDQGEEDTLTNLLRYGVTYTKLPRIDWPLLFQYGRDPAATKLVQGRADDMIRGLASPGDNEHLLTMRAFVLKKNLTPDTRKGRVALKKYLLSNVLRMQREYVGYLQERKKYESGPKDEARWLEFNAHLYAHRGISLDTDIRPNYAVDRVLEVLSAKAMISAGSVRRVAIVGPGLDFVNKENGTDLYPPQTIQPIAVIDSLLRLQLADPDKLQVVTYDISSSVNHHLNRAKQKAMQGVPYRIYLPVDASTPWAEDFLAYWQSFGAKIAMPATPTQIPDAAANIKLRAVNVKPELVTRVTPVDMNVVFQYVSLPESQGFDLVIGTNVFVYYGAFEQSLARENLARMLAPGGILISNNLLSGTPSSLLKESARVQVLFSKPKNSDLLFVYQRK